jgi:hypothetical protein
MSMALIELVEISNKSLGRYFVNFVNTVDSWMYDLVKEHDHNVAVCMVGMARTLWYPEVYTSYIHNIKYLEDVSKTSIKLFTVLELQTGKVRGTETKIQNQSDYDLPLKSMGAVEVKWTHNQENTVFKDPICGFDKYAHCLDLVKSYENKHKMVM